MKLTFLGTGASEGIPAFRCGCRICSEAREKKGKHIRQNASLHLESDSGVNVLIDMPAQIKMMLEKYSLGDTSLDVILFTHYHIDHTAGIFHLLESLESNGHVPVNPVRAYMSEDCYRTVMEGIFTDQIDMKNTDYSSFYSLEILRHLEKASCRSLQFQALDTNHLAGRSSALPERECHGYLFSENSKRAAYMVDSSSDLPSSTLSALKGSVGDKLDCLVFECTFDRYPGPGRGHSDHEGVLKIRDLLKPERMILSHISHRNSGHDELAAFMGRHGIEVAFDGLSIEV